MRRLFFGLVVLTCLSSGQVSATDIPVTGKITAATVYSDRATLTRQGKVTIPAGAHTLVFKGLPVNMFTDSLRADGKSTAKVTFGAVTFKMESHEDYVIPKEKALRDRLLLLEDTKRSIDADRQALIAGKTFIENLGKQAALRSDEDIAEIDLKPDTWAAAANSIQAKISENLKAMITQDIATRNIDEEIRKIHDELNQLQTGQKQTFEVSIPYESNIEAELTVDLSYQQPSVSWQPVYDARFDTKTGKLELVQYGSVWQQTGEDWTDVALTLSTAQPSRGTGLPDLYTQWLSLYSAQPAMMEKSRNMAFSTMSANVTGMAAAPEAMPMPMGSAAGGGMDFAADALTPVEEDATFASAQINTEGFVGEYKITGPSTVKSDGTQSKLLIGAFNTEAIRQVQIKPQMSTDAYLVVKTTLKGDAPILPGQVNLFRDNAFIGQTVLPMLRPNDVQELAFGIDDKVTVKRNVKKDERSEYGLVVKDQVLERNFVTEIQNLHKEEVAIAVLETIPASQDQKIKVEIVKNETTPGYEENLKDVKGVTRWVLTLKPEEKTKVNLGWKVSWPKGENVSGL